MQIPVQVDPRATSLNVRIPPLYGFDNLRLNFAGAQYVDFGVTLGALGIVRDVTFMVWNRLTNFTADRYVMGSATAAGANIVDMQYLLASNNYRVTVVTGAVVLVLGGTPSNKLTCLTSTYDGANVILYQDGVVVGGPTPQVGNILAPSGNLTLGRPGSYNGLYWIGQIYMALAYNVALSQSQIRYNLRNPYNPIKNGLVLWANLEEGAGLRTNCKMGNVGSLLPAINPPIWRRTKKWELGNLNR